MQRQGSQSGPNNLFGNQQFGGSRGGANQAFSAFGQASSLFGQGGANQFQGNPFSRGWGVNTEATNDPNWFANRYDKNYRNNVNNPQPPTPSGGDPGGASSGVEGTRQWQEIIDRVAKESGVPWHVIASIMAIESGGANVGPNAAGATGLMQVIPKYWQSVANNYGGDLMDPYTNIRTAAEILKMGYGQYGSWEHAAAFFNGGGGAIDANGNILNNPDPYNGNTVHNYVDAFRNNMAYFGYGSASMAEWAANGAAATSWGQGAVDTAATAIGAPYVWGGESWEEGGFDCSGLVQWAYSKYGVNPGRTAQEQFNNTQRIGYDSLQPGDLVFYSEGNGITHVAIYAGNGTIIDAPREGKTIRKIAMNTPWYQQHFVGFGRVYR